MVVAEGVDHLLALALELDQVRLLQAAQLMRDSALRHAHYLGDVAHAQVLPHQGVQNLDARGVGEHLEQVGEVVEQFLVGHLLDGRLLGIVKPCALGVCHVVLLLTEHMSMCSYV